MRPGWTAEPGDRFRRADGAVVKWDGSSPYPNPARASARMWTAWEPDPSTRALSQPCGRRFRRPRRYRTAEAAMAAVDRAFPRNK